MGDEAVEKIQLLLEQLNSRFELVLEHSSRFSDGLKELREEMVSQFSEVGKQIRFLSDQIGDNRARLTSLRSDLATEMVRLNEVLGATRVQMRDDLAGIGELKGAITGLSQFSSGQQSFQAKLSGEIGERLAQAHRTFAEDLDRRAAELRREIDDRLGDLSRQMRTEPAGAADGRVAAEIHNEVKVTHKAVTNLAKKFDRFDDKISVQVKDQEQRLRKLERQAR